MTPAITGGDVDVDVEDAYFTGDEAPGGDNPTPDQDVVDDIGKALGRRVSGQRGAEGRRQGRRARQAPLGARSGVGGGLQGQENRRSTWPLPALDAFTSAITSPTTSLDRFPGRVDDDRVVGARRAARRRACDRSRRVASAASPPRDTAAGPPVCAGSLRAAARALFRRRVEIDLHVGIAETRPCRCRALPSRSRRRRRARADARPAPRAPSAGARPPAAARSISGVRIARVTSTSSIVDARRSSISMRARSASAAIARLVVERHAVAERLPADRAVHRAAVHVAVAERGRDRARDRALAGAGRTVDGDDQRFHGTDRTGGSYGSTETSQTYHAPTARPTKPALLNQG